MQLQGLGLGLYAGCVGVSLDPVSKPLTLSGGCGDGGMTGFDFPRPGFLFGWQFSGKESSLHSPCIVPIKTLHSPYVIPI